MHANIFTYHLVTILYTISLYIELPNISNDGNVSHRLNSMLCKENMNVYAYNNQKFDHTHTCSCTFMKCANISATYIFG